MATLLENIIELRWQYDRYFGGNSLILVPKVGVSHHGDIEVWFNCEGLSLQSIEKIKAHFIDFRSVTEEQGWLHFKTTIQKTHSYDEDLTRFLEPRFCYSVLSTNKYYYNSSIEEIPNAAAIFGIIFLLGTIVRYHPEKLYGLIYDKDTSVQWILNEICQIGERVYPNLMLNLISAVKLKFGQGSDL